MVSTMNIPNDFISTFLERHQLPQSFAELATRWYLPLCDWLLETRPAVLGINGSQGSGKSTLADFIAERFATAGKNVAVLSIDDLYLTKAQRTKLAQDVHPLLATRGVPGTHDVELGVELVQKLQTLGRGEGLELPVFDKAADDRSAVGKRCTGPVDMVILEGWCVGSVAQAPNDLLQSVNALEATEDSNGTWLRYVNNQLVETYPALFRLIDALVLLKVPTFEQVYHWRCEQEHKLEQATGRRGMSDSQIERFIQHYERLTRWNLLSLPSQADAVFELNKSHGIDAGRIEATAL